MIKAKIKKLNETGNPSFSDGKKLYPDLYLESIKNRFNFLEAKKKAWLKCKSEHKKKELIVELIQLEPSHLAEDWILDQVIKWLKDRASNIDFLNEAFIARGVRNELTDTQRDNLAKTSFLDHEISILKPKAGNRTAAIRKYVVDSDDDDSLPEEPEKAIEQKLKRYRKTLDSRALPFPYYGYDFIEFDRGNENHRIEYYIFNKPVAVGESVFFGNTKISIPLKSSTE